MSDFFTLDIGFESYHLVFPWAIGTILVVLLILMGIQKLVAVNRGRSDTTSSKKSARPGFRLFDKGFDAKKLFGALACIVIYMLVLNPLGFLISSILFMIAISLVFRPVTAPRALIGVAANSVLTPLIIWLAFGQLFDITLP